MPAGSGDLVGDLIYYWIGRTGRTPLIGLARRLGVRRTVPTEVQAGLTNNATKMLLIGKWTHTIGCFVLVGSGMLRLPLPRFILINLLATIPKSAVLFCIGYFAGNLCPLLERHYTAGAIVLSVVAVAAIVVILRRAEGIWAGGTGR